MKKIYFVRHARQNSKLCNVNVELSEQGKMQAEILGKRLENYNINIIYSSHLIRAVETSSIINCYLNVPHIIRNQLEEINYGLLTGHTDEYIQEYFGDYKRKRWEMKSDIPFPEGENGQMVLQRTKEVLNEIEKRKEESILVVTHGGVIRSLIAYMLGMQQAEKLKIGIHLENCGITEVLYDDEMERYFLERFNDYAHFEGMGELLRNNWK